MILISPLFVSCGGASDQSEEGVNETIIGNYFPSFPEQPFLSLKYGEPIQESQFKIESQGFTNQSESPFRFRSEDSTVVIVQESEYLSSFKVFFHSKVILASKTDLENMLNKHAENVAGEEEFIVYNYKGDYDYKITQFNQPDYIRLNFELKASH